MLGQLVTYCLAHVLIVGREAVLPSVAGPSTEPVEYDLAGDEEHDLVEPCVERAKIGGIPWLVDSRQEQAAASVIHEVPSAVTRREDLAEYECRRRPKWIVSREHDPQADFLPYAHRKLDGEARVYCQVAPIRMRSRHRREAPNQDRTVCAYADETHRRLEPRLYRSDHGRNGVTRIDPGNAVGATTAAAEALPTCTFFASNASARSARSRDSARRRFAT
jgi:hypothetical protein